MDINSTTLEKAMEVMAPALGLSVDTNRDEILKSVNKYRNLLYNLYADNKLFDDYKVCCEIQKFSASCGDPDQSCDDFYYGVTLPDDMAGVVAAWEYNTPLTLNSRWRESHVGLRTSDTPTGHLIEMPETSPTEKELKTSSKIKVFTYHESDHGKVVDIRAYDKENNLVNIELTLESDAYVYSNTEIREIHSVVLPNLCGCLELKAGDCTLSKYYPHEYIPRYRRFKVAKHCGTQHLLIQGTRKYRDLADPRDVVEIGDILILEAAGRYFRYSENSTDVEDMQRAEYDYRKMIEQLNGLVARHRGRMLQDGSPVSRARRGKINSGLSGKMRGYPW